MTIQVPGRTLSADEDLTGTSPGLEALRWTVIVRDGRACDVLGEGRPKSGSASGTDAAGEDEPAADARSGLSMWWLVAGAAVAILGIAGYVVRRAR